MNRGHVLQSSSSLGMQQMMAVGNPNWSSSSSSSPYQFPPSSHHPSFFIPQLHPSYSSLPFLPSWHENNNNNNQNQELPESLSQLLLGGLVSEDDRANGLRQLIQQAKKLEEWEEHMLRNQSHDSHPVNNIVGVKQENSSRFAYGFHGSTTHENDNEDFNHHQTASLSQIMPASSSAALASSPNSSKTSFGVNVLDFSGKSEARHPPPSRSSPECNSNASGGAAKKARVQHCSSSSAQPTFKVRKEKLGDRVTALHQIVSPFGKTDTASVLLEAIGYIRFLHNQIEALSLPYLGSGSPNMRQQQHSTTLTTVHGERNCMFPEDPGQLLNENNCMKMKYGNEEEPKLDLRSRGLCLVPVSCTTQVGGDNGADYWAPAALGGSGFQ